MALNLSLMLSPNINYFKSHSLKRRQFVTNCELNESKSSKLEIGSPIIVIEAPQLIKTAASVPCLRANSGLIKPGDVGRIVSRKPKDVWAVRLSVGTYLIDGKYFKPLKFLNECELLCFKDTKDEDVKHGVVILDE